MGGDGEVDDDDEDVDDDGDHDAVEDCWYARSERE